MVRKAYSVIKVLLGFVLFSGSVFGQDHVITIYAGFSPWSGFRGSGVGHTNPIANPYAWSNHSGFNDSLMNGRRGGFSPEFKRDMESYLTGTGKFSSDKLDQHFSDRQASATFFENNVGALNTSLSEISLSRPPNPISVGAAKPALDQGMDRVWQTSRASKDHYDTLGEINDKLKEAADLSTTPATKKWGQYLKHELQRGGFIDGNGIVRMPNAMSLARDFVSNPDSDFGLRLRSTFNSHLVGESAINGYCANTAGAEGACGQYQNFATELHATYGLADSALVQGEVELALNLIVALKAYNDFQEGLVVGVLQGSADLVNDLVTGIPELIRNAPEIAAAVGDALVNLDSTWNRITELAADYYADLMTATPGELGETIGRLVPDIVSSMVGVGAVAKIGKAAKSSKIFGQAVSKIYAADKVEDMVSHTRMVGKHNPISPGPMHRREASGNFEIIGGDGIPVSGSTVADTFRSGTYLEGVAQEPTKLYRVFSKWNFDRDKGHASYYWSRTKPEGPTAALIDSALDPNFRNTASYWTEIEVPAGTRFYEGVTAPIQYSPGNTGVKGRLVGGGNQVFLDPDLDFETIRGWVQGDPTRF